MRMFEPFPHCLGCRVLPAWCVSMMSTREGKSLVRNVWRKTCCYGWWLRHCPFFHCHHHHGQQQLLCHRPPHPTKKTALPALASRLTRNGVLLLAALVGRQPSRRRYTRCQVTHCAGCRRHTSSSALQASDASFDKRHRRIREVHSSRYKLRKPTVDR